MGSLKNIKRDSRGRIPQKWCVESALNESKKYKSKKDFINNANSAYQYLVKHKKINLVHLPGKRHRLDTWDIFCSLKKSNTWGEFRKKFPKEYTAFHKRKGLIAKSAFSHLGISKTAKRWTKEAIKNEAKKYKHKSHFRNGASGAYDAAINYGILDSVCSHMTPLQSDFDCVYIWVAKKTREGFLVKFGVTSKRLGLARIEFVEKKSGHKAREVVISDRSDALRIEKYLKTIGKSASFKGFSGASEFFWLTESQLKKAKEVIKNEAAKR